MIRRLLVRLQCNTGGVGWLDVCLWLTPLMHVMTCLWGKMVEMK
jgi:hypothetical protein